LLHLTHVVVQNVTQKIQTSPAVAASSSGCTSHFKVKTDVTLAGASRSRIMRLFICASEHRVLAIRSRITFSLFLLQRTIHPAACGPNSTTGRSSSPPHPSRIPQQTLWPHLDLHLGAWWQATAAVTATHRSRHPVPVAAYPGRICTSTTLRAFRCLHDFVDVLDHSPQPLALLS
jgi:hypothetical protein